MRVIIHAAVTVGALLMVVGSASAQAPAGLGTEEFGLSQRELVQAIEKVETLISKCMREQGFEYIAADYLTVRQGMSADKTLPGLDEEEFVKQYGWGVSTLYTGQAPQLAEGYSPAKVGLGKRNVQIFRKLSPADQVAYNRALLGANTDATFAVGLETEDFSRCAGCTRTAVAQVFKPDELKPTYYNPKDALVNKDSRMKAALRYYTTEMRKAGFDYSHPDDLEADIRERLAAITEGSTVLVEKLSPEQRAALRELQDFERRLAVKNRELKLEVFEPLEESILRDLFPREVK